MARGRMISKSLSTSERWSALHAEAGKLAEFCQVLFTLLVTHADDHGRLEGSAFTIKHMVVPTSPRREAEVATALGILDRIGLIQWYEANGGSNPPARYIQISKFGDHQSLRGHDDRASKFPDPPARTQNRPDPPKVPLSKEKRTKENLREGNLSVSAVPALIAHYHDGYLKRFHEKPHIIGGKDGKILKTLLAEYGEEAVRQRIDRLLDSKAKFFVEGGRTIGQLAHGWNQLSGPKPALSSGACQGLHRPPCKDDAECTKRRLAEMRGQP